MMGTRHARPEQVQRSPKGLVQFAIARGKTPSDFSEAEVDAWGESLIRQGRKHATVRMLKSLFRKVVVRAALRNAFPTWIVIPNPVNTEFASATCPSRYVARSQNY